MMALRMIGWNSGARYTPLDRTHGVLPVPTRATIVSSTEFERHCREAELDSSWVEIRWLDSDGPRTKMEPSWTSGVNTDSGWAVESRAERFDPICGACADLDRAATPRRAAVPAMHPVNPPRVQAGEQSAYTAAAHYKGCADGGAPCAHRSHRPVPQHVHQQRHLRPWAQIRE